jgi:hypothetical protein
VVDEINQVMAMIDAAAGSASSYTESLTSVSDMLGDAKDREALRAIVESLVSTADEMKRATAPWKRGCTRREKRSINCSITSPWYAPRA